MVETYQKLVVNTCFGLLQNTKDGEDIAQEVFIEVFRSIQNFRSDAKLSTWLYRIAVYGSLNHIRDNKRRKWFQSFDDVVKEKNAQLHQHHASENPGIELGQPLFIFHKRKSSASKLEISTSIFSCR